MKVLFDLSYVDFFKYCENPENLDRDFISELDLYLNKNKIEVNVGDFFFSRMMDIKESFTKERREENGFDIDLEGHPYWRANHGKFSEIIKKMEMTIWYSGKVYYCLDKTNNLCPFFFLDIA